MVGGGAAALEWMASLRKQPLLPLSLPFSFPSLPPEHTGRGTQTGRGGIPTDTPEEHCGAHDRMDRSRRGEREVRGMTQSREAGREGGTTEVVMRRKSHQGHASMMGVWAGLAR